MKATRVVRGPLADRLFSRLQPMPSGCIEYVGKRNRQGYGYISLGPKGARKYIRTHRLAWETNNGPIPEGLDLCHSCDNPPCCNPDHLFAGTRTDNMQDMSQKNRSYYGQRTHCFQGHPYTEANTYIRGDGRHPARRCRTCRDARAKARQLAA